MNQFHFLLCVFVCVLSVICCSFLLFFVCKRSSGKFCYRDLPSVCSGNCLGCCNILCANRAWRSRVCEHGISHVSVQQQGSLHPVLKDVQFFHSKLTFNICDCNVSCFAEFKLKELFLMLCQTIASIYAARTRIRHNSFFEQSNISLQKAVFFTFVHLEHAKETSLMKKLHVGKVLMILNICSI
jgi:hypothetical protein